MDKLTYQQAAKELNTSVQALRNKVSNQSISLAKEGNRAYFTREQIEALRPRQDNKIVNVYLKLSPDQAEALAQFVKRMRHDIARGIASDDAEAFEMMAAADALRVALADAGHSPR